MPFTFSHPAAIHPVYRSFPWMSFPALFIGALTPDVGYYFPIHEYFLVDAHTLVRSFTFCLPVGWIFVGLFYWLRKAFIRMCFEPHGKKMLSTMKPPQIDSSFFVVVSLSLVIGSWTHIVWDSFTHKTRYFVENIPVLQLSLFRFGESHYHIYNLLQHLSGIGGLTYLLYVFHRWSNIRKTRFDLQRTLIWFSLFLLSLIGLFFVDLHLPFEQGFFGWRVATFNLATVFLRVYFSLLLVLLVAFSLPSRVFLKIQK